MALSGASGSGWTDLELMLGRISVRNQRDGTIRCDDVAFGQLPAHLRRLLGPIAEGKSNQEIARDLCLGLHTVEVYVSQILELTACRSRSVLIVRLLTSAGVATGGNRAES